MNALAIHLYLTIRDINLSFNYFGNFYRIIVYILIMKIWYQQKNNINFKNIHNVKKSNIGKEKYKFEYL